MPNDFLYNNKLFSKILYISQLTKPLQINLNIYLFYIQNSISYVTKGFLEDM